MWIKRLMCLHFWVKPEIQRTRPNGMFGFITQWEWKCKECGKVKWSDYENVEPEPNKLLH